MPIPSSYCHAALPNAGLGNKLLVWARAAVFAELNHLPLLTTNLVRPQLASFIAGGSLRCYWNTMKRGRGEAQILLSRLFSHERVLEPDLRRYKRPLQATGFVFQKMPDWRVWFEDIHEHRDLVRRALLCSLTKDRSREIADLPGSSIGVHIRMSDFRRVQSEEEFARTGAARTPLQFFVDSIRSIREMVGINVKVQIVSDGSVAELAPVLRLENVQFDKTRSEVADIFLLANSKIKILSSGSSFGLWGAFLGRGLILEHPAHYRIRPFSLSESGNDYHKPMPTDPATWPESLKSRIRQVLVEPGV